MNAAATRDAYGTLIEPTTLKIQRLLPGPIERVWSYLTDSDMRRKWLAAGKMEMKVGSPFEFVWRNDELTDPPGKRPVGFGEEHRMKSRITAVDPPRKLVFSWEGSGDVSFELEPKGDEVLLQRIVSPAGEGRFLKHRPVANPAADGRQRAAEALGILLGNRDRHRQCPGCLQQDRALLQDRVRCCHGRQQPLLYVDDEE